MGGWTRRTTASDPFSLKGKVTAQSETGMKGQKQLQEAVLSQALRKGWDGLEGCSLGCLWNLLHLC